MAARARTDFLSNDNKIEPPGINRSYSEPTKTGKIPFEYATTGLKGETAYRLWGDLSSSKPPLICLHGGPGVPSDYILSLTLIYNDFDIPVVLYDQVGCGDSTRFPEQKGNKSFWPEDLFMAELDNLKSHLGITTFDLYGQSWGGMLAGQYAATQQPKGLRKLIISNSPHSIDAWVAVTDVQRMHLPESVRAVLDECEKTEEGIASQAYEDATMDFYAKHMCRLTNWPPEVLGSFEKLAKDNTVYSTMFGPNEFMCIGSLRPWDLREDLKKITPQTAPGGLLLINGFYETAQDDATDCFFWNPTCKVKWARFALSAHMPHVEEAEKYIEVVGDFLKN